MGNPLAHVDPSTWRVMRDIYEGYYREKSLTDWLSDMRRAHWALRGEDVRVVRCLSEAIAILEYTIIVRDGHLVREIADSLVDKRSNEGADSQCGALSVHR
ncbi:hypothetical protein OKW43_002958 [Paraburkholderia sp. WC7.3g]|uniref:hypothetical protein n=1 Tax=Paraburkholderia sp. WC7.3g TaxID=2991070 RepID=UPI003D247BED